MTRNEESGREQARRPSKTSAPDNRSLAFSLAECVEPGLAWLGAGTVVGVRLHRIFLFILLHYLLRRKYAYACARGTIDYAWVGVRASPGVGLRGAVGMGTAPFQFSRGLGEPAHLSTTHTG